MATIKLLEIELDIDGGFEVETIRDYAFLKKALSGATVTIKSEDGLTIASGKLHPVDYELLNIDL